MLEGERHFSFVERRNVAVRESTGGAARPSVLPADGAGAQDGRQHRCQDNELLLLLPLPLR